MASQIIPLLGIASPGYTPEPLRTITVNATFEGEQTTVYKEAVLLDSASLRNVLVYFPLRDGKHSSHTLLTSAIDDPDKNRVIMLYGSSPEDQAVVSKTLKITSDLNILLDLSETGGGIVDYPLLTGIGKLSGFFDLQSLPESVNYSDITIIANYRDPLEGTYNGLQAGKTTCEIDGSWAIEGLNEAHRYNVVMSIPTFNDITYSNKETSDSTYVPRDPHWDNVVLLMHFEDSFADEKGGSYSSAGTIGYAEGKFGQCLKISTGNSGVIAPTVDTALDLPGDFTIEGWLRPDAYSSGAFINRFEVVAGVGVGWQLYLENNGKISFYQTVNGSGSYPIYQAGPDLRDGQWHHIAATRQGSSLRLFVDGVVVGAVANVIDYTSSIALLSIGFQAQGQARYPIRGDIDDVRITKGVARYTEDFTPSDKPFPNH